MRTCTGALSAVLLLSGCGRSDFSQQAEKLADTFLQQLAEGRCDEAYRLMARAYRSKHTAPQLCERAAKSSYLVHGGRVSFSSTAMGTVQNLSDATDPTKMSPGWGEGVLVAKEGRIDCRFQFVAEGGEWKIFGVALAGVPILQSVTDDG